MFSLISLDLEMHNLPSFALTHIKKVPNAHLLTHIFKAVCNTSRGAVLRIQCSLLPSIMFTMQLHYYASAFSHTTVCDIKVLRSSAQKPKISSTQMSK